MKYTVQDTPENVARIESDLQRVVEAVRQADPHLRSLVLTGGFARGEGAMMDGRPQNDYDFVAVRRLGRPRRSYAAVRDELEKELGLHVDLATIGRWRLRRARPSIFWYETALRGRVLWGENVLPQIPIRKLEQVDEGEGLRLLVNRAAGLLLVTDSRDPHQHRIQAAKGLLAAMDAHLFSQGVFPPTQTERWREFERLYEHNALLPALRNAMEWFDWAYAFKVAPSSAPVVDASKAWRAAARAILDAVPVALRHAGLDSLDAYAKHDRFMDHVVYWVRSSHVPEARRLITNPTSRVRVATLRLLEASLDGTVRPEAAQASLAKVARPSKEPLRLLDGLRKATLQ